jgi:hypothetical protein
MRNIAAYVPTEGALIYHYCSPSTLLAILRTKTLRLADVSEMNDSMERQWGLDALAEELASRGDNLPDVVLSTVEQAIKGARDGAMCLASCFSSQGDVLSQWRAYADNGAGFAIGVDPFALEHMPITLLEICYDRQAQAGRISDGLDHVLELYSAIGQDEDDFVDVVGDEESTPEGNDVPPHIRAQVKRYVRSAQFLVYDLVAFKNPAFSEESEVRIVHFASVDEDNGHRVDLVSNGFPDKWQGRPAPVIDFSMRGSVPVCHVDVPISADAIREVVIGPRANVSDLALMRLLSSLGFPHVETSRSVATYR